MEGTGEWRRRIGLYDVRRRGGKGRSLSLPQAGPTGPSASEQGAQARAQRLRKRQMLKKQKDGKGEGQEDDGEEGDDERE